MLIEVNTDRNIQGSEELNAFVERVLEQDLGRFEKAITRIEVHLADENADKTGERDKRCTLEARIAHHQPMAVTHHADSVHQAIEQASHKLLRALNSMEGRMREFVIPKGMIAKKEQDSSL